MKMLDFERKRDQATRIMKINITPELKAALELRHSKVRERDRIKAILLRYEDWTIMKIAQALLIDESTIIRHLKDFVKNQKLNPENGEAQSYLSTAQTEQLIAQLTKTIYFHAHQICSYIEKPFAIKYSVPNLNKWLHNNWFSYKQPKVVPHKFDAEKQDCFCC